MMDFVQFARAHGVMLDGLPPEGRWVRVRTEDKPRSRNGAVKWLGDVGFVQNWATMEEPAVWRGEETGEARQRVRQSRIDATREADRLAQKAAQKAARILADCEIARHSYFAAKGFPELLVNVWKDGLAVVPMRRGRQLVGCQLISEDGDKKFLYGQRSGGAEFVIGQSGKHILCEGYATALSAQVVLRNLKAPYVLHVTFSAGNMKRIAQDIPGGIVLADNDASGTGERVAREIGWPYWMSDVVGEDFNDAHQRCGTFALSMELGKFLRRGGMDKMPIPKLERETRFSEYRGR